MNNEIELTKEEYEMLDEEGYELILKCEFEVNCINCGELVMYADPTHHEGMQLPDMVCLKCVHNMEVMLSNLKTEKAKSKRIH